MQSALLKLNKIKLEFLYLVFMTFFGVSLVFITPPFQVPDEIAHFSRAYQISEGEFRGVLIESAIGDEKFYFAHAYIPNSFGFLLTAPKELTTDRNYYSLNLPLESFSVPIDSEPRTDIYIPGSGTYSPIVYAPQALTAFIARNIFNTVGAVFYGGRLSAVIFAMICTFLSMKLLPEKKLLIFLISFMPMFLFETASFSADSVVYSISFLGIAYLLSLRKKDTPISSKEIILMSLVAISVGLAKQIYGVILLLYLFIPVERFGSRKKFYCFGIYLLGIYMFSVLGWMEFLKQGLNVSPALLDGANMALQMDYIKNNPLTYAKINIYTFVSNFSGYYLQFVGVLGWLSIILPNWFYNFYGILLIAGGMIGNLNLNKKQHSLLFLSVVPVILVTFLYMYLTWCPVGFEIIQGVQGRYFIPCALMVFSALSCLKNNSYEIIIALVAALTSGSLTVQMLVERFFL